MWVEFHFRGGDVADKPDLLAPFDTDIIASVADKVNSRSNYPDKSVTDLLESHQRSIYDSVTEARYIEFRHEVQEHSFCEDEETCFFIVPTSVWDLEQTHTDFTERELTAIEMVHTRQTRRRARQTGREQATHLLKKQCGFVVYKPEFMKRAYRLQTKTLLSEREAEVQALAEQEYSSTTIGEILGISNGTVDAMRYNRIPKKLDAARATVDLLDEA